MNLTKRQFLHLLSAGTLPTLLSSPALAETYPSRPITMVVPYPPGGSGDSTARAVSPTLSARLGQPVVVQNIAGASGTIAAQKILNERADGYYLYRGSLAELELAPLSIPSLKFRGNDFQLVQLISQPQLALIVRKGLPVNSVDEFLAYAEQMARQGKPLTYASTGPGSIYHLLGTRLSKVTGIEMMHVPYKGGGPADQALLSEEVDFYFIPLLSQHREFQKKGMLKVLAVLSKERVPEWAEFPAIGESARAKDMALSIAGGFYVKRGTPQAILEVLNKALGDALQDPAVQSSLRALNQKPAKPISLAETEQAHKEGIEQFRELARSAGILQG